MRLQPLIAPPACELHYSLRKKKRSPDRLLLLIQQQDGRQEAAWAERGGVPQRECAPSVICLRYLPCILLPRLLSGVPCVLILSVSACTLAAPSQRESEIAHSLAHAKR